MARLSRVVCADPEILMDKEIFEMARHIEEEQIRQIAEGLDQVYRRMKPKLRGNKISVAITGIGRNFLARRAVEKAGLGRIIDIGEIAGSDVASRLPSFGVAVMMASKLTGRDIEWWKQ